MKKVNSAIVSIGSNYRNRSQNVEKALKWIKDSFTHCRFSSIYETPEVHGAGSPYMNAVCIFETSCDLATLTERSKIYEERNGRTPETRKRGEVPIDIDIVVWNGEVLRSMDFSCNFFKIGYSELCCASV